MQRLLIHFLALGLAGFAADVEPLTLTLTLLPNLSSPQPVGTIITLMPRLKNSTHVTYVAQYSVSVDGGAFHMIRDFSQDMPLIWSPELYEHEARVRVTVRNNDTMETVAAELPFRIVSRVKDGRPVVTPTAHPLVALLSAPPCPAGSRFRVEFRKVAESLSSHTSAEPCRAGRSSNVYVAGMRADTDYQMRPETIGGDTESGAWITFHTGLLDGRFPPVSIPTPRAGGARSSDPLLVSSMAMEPYHNQATDLEGNVVWTMASPAFLTRIVPGGRFLVLAEGANSQNDIKRWQLVRELDLLGNILRETNVSRVAEQLASRGIRSKCMKDGQQCVSGFHHEAIRLPNGHTLVIAGLERMFPDGAQGAKDPVDVLGDLVIDLDAEFQVSWVWNSFDHMNVTRKSLGDEKCKLGPGSRGCPSVFLAATANGWLHSNSLSYIHGSADLLISIPEQDWVVKIDYKDGKGTGKVLWRLGLDGDFKAKSDDPYPWFSYQHDVGFDPPGSNRLIVFDDGDRRIKKFPKSNNRGQVWELDEQAMTATLVVNADLGVYSPAVGSAQSLSGGGFSFESGMVNPPAVSSRATEVGADGKIVYAQQSEGTGTYRSFRVPDLYTPHAGKMQSLMRKFGAAALMLTGLTAVPKEVSFPSPDGGVVWGDLYGAGDRAVVLAHGARFNKASWPKQAEVLANAGFRVLAIAFRGYGKSHGGDQSSSGGGEKYQDILAAIRYLRENGAKTVSVIGASMGGGAAATAFIHARPGEVDRLVLLAHVPVAEPERLTGPKLFVTSSGDGLADKVREQFEKAPEPKELVILDGSAHAQFLFETDQGKRLMNKLLDFLSKP